MKFVLMTIVSPERMDAWEAASSEERQANVDETIAWFRDYSGRGWITGGAELGLPARAKTVRRRGVTDGPYAETKEVLGGFITVDVPTEADAIEMASRWPGLEFDGDAVEVRPEGDTAGDVAAERT